MATGPGAIRRAWYQWKMRRFPWRKKWLVGFDLHGNTFWEFKDALHALRNRRIAKYSRSTHYGDVNVSPSWMQWLRHTRYDPPTLAEQQHDVMRQERMKMLAAQADAKWAAKPSALDAPDKQQPAPMLQSRDPDSVIANSTSQYPIIDEMEERRRVSEPDPIVPLNADIETPQQSPPSDTPPSTDNAPTLKTRKMMKKEPKDSPWKQAAGISGEEWQPQKWTPPPARRRG